MAFFSIRRVIFVLLLTLILVAPIFVMAADAPLFKELANYDKSPQFKKAYSANSLPQYFNAIFRIALTIGGIIAVLRLVYAGFIYMRSTDNTETLKKARTIISDVIIGTLVLLGIYLILYQINPCMLNLDILNGGKGTAWQCAINDAKQPT